jgi:hypothetical protein
MDEAYALAMRDEGISYREIGIELARRERRKTPYGYYAVYNAVARFKKLLEKDCDEQGPT